MLAIDIQGLTKTYTTGTRALNGVNLQVQEGDFFALLGANGAGKTTIIGILTSLVKKSSGTVSVFGSNLDQDPDSVKAYLGVVPQEFNFSIFEKVIDIVVDQAGFYGVPREQAHQRAEELLKALELWEKKDLPSRALSGGMKRRLMIVRALMHKPRILLLDEPTAGVDVELRYGMWEYLKRLNAAGTTIVLTTHYLEEVEQLCRNVAILKKGEKVHDSSVASLIGTMPQRVFRITIDGSPEKIEATGIRVIAKTAQSIDVELDDAQTITQLSQKLAESGIVIRDIRPTANRLEQAYLGITNG